MKLTKTRLKRIIKEELNKVLLKESDEVLKSGENIIIFSNWAQGHIIKGHTKPGQGSIFKKVNMDIIMAAVKNTAVEGKGGVYTTEASEHIGYDLVLPMSEAVNLENAKKVSVQKEDRQGAVEVVGIKTSKPLEKFATSKLSVVIRQSTMEYVPDDLKDNPEIQAAARAGKLYGVLSSWPGRGDVPSARDWGEKWAVVIPQSKG